MKKYLILLVLLVSVFVANGCKKKDDTVREADANSLPKAVEHSQDEMAAKDVAIVDGNDITRQQLDKPVKHKAQEVAKTEVMSKDIVAIVNGNNITRQQLDEKTLAEMVKVKKQMPEPFFTQYKQELGKKVLDDMVTQIILDQKVAENKITVSDTEIDEYIMAMSKQNGMTAQDFLDLLNAKGEKVADYRENLRKDLSYRKLIELKTGGDPVDVNDDKIAGYYAQHKAEFTRPENAGVAGKNERVQLTLEEARQDIIEKLKRQEHLKSVSSYIMSLKKQANIVYPLK